MNPSIRLAANDGHSFAAYLAEPAAETKGGLVVLQEIFGVNHHMRSVADLFAREGYWTVAPALFERIRPGVELKYDEEGVKAGKELAFGLKQEEVLLDISATIEYVRASVAPKKVGIVGYCFGGSYAWLSATRLRPDAAVCYYGSMIARTAQETPSCPVQMHFGKNDKGIPVSDVEQIIAAHPALEIHLYDAGHGFSCDERPSYAPDAAALALSRTLAFFGVHLGGAA